VKNQTYKIPINDIYYIECCRKHVIYHLKNKTIETVDKLSSAYNALSDFGFYQIHQGYIINFDKVYEFKDYSVVLEDKRTVMMSVRKKREVLLAYAKYTERFI
jgi:DNA-binding LytR/AlgR family response regulator